MTTRTRLGRLEKRLGAGRCPGRRLEIREGTREALAALPRPPACLCGRCLGVVAVIRPPAERGD